MNQAPCNRWVDNLVTISENLEQAPQHVTQELRKHVAPPHSPSEFAADYFDDNFQEQALQEEYVEMHPSAGKKYGRDKTFLESFDDDRHAPQRSANLFFPFASKEDWQVGVWLSRSRLSMAAIDSFLSLPMVSYLVRTIIIFYLNSHWCPDRKASSLFQYSCTTAWSHRTTPIGSEMELQSPFDIDTHEEACPALLA
jgi:hypothetical protein